MKSTTQDVKKDTKYKRKQDNRMIKAQDRFMEDLDLRELKRLQQLSANMLSEASLKGDRDGIIMWYNAYREKEGEIYDLERRLDINKNLNYSENV